MLEEPVLRHDQQLRRHDSLGRGGPGLIVDEGKFAKDVVGAQDLDRGFVPAWRGLEDPYLTLQDNVQLAAGISLVEDDLVLVISSQTKFIDKSRQISVAELGEERHLSETGNPSGQPIVVDRGAHMTPRCDTPLSTKTPPP